MVVETEQSDFFLIPLPKFQERKFIGSETEQADKVGRTFNSWGTISSTMLLPDIHLHTHCIKHLHYQFQPYEVEHHSMDNR